MTIPILQTNLAALHPVTPDAAAAISAAVPHPDWLPTPGTDSTPTFQRRLPDSIQWLGGTSMPRASAAPLTASMTPGTGLGLGIGTGHEWQHLLTRMPPHQLLYVLEPDPVAARLALSICDLSAPLASARLILLVGPTADAQLSQLLDREPGMEPPAVMHPLPTLTGEARNTLLTLGEKMIRQVVLARSARMEAAAAQLQLLPPGTARIAMLLTPRHQWDRPVGPANPGIPTLTLDHHRTGGRLARMEFCLRHHPAVIVTDLWRGQLEIPIPENVIVETWVPPMVGMGFWQPDRLPPVGGRDRVVVHGTAHKDWLVRAGVGAERVRVVAGGMVLRSSQGQASHGHAFANSVVMVADLPTISAAEYGITLPSHVAIWDAARDLIAADPLAAHWEMVPDLFRRAQQRAAVEVTDPSLADSLQRGIRLALMEAVVPLEVARQLNAAGIPLVLVGAGWEQAKLLQNVELRTWADGLPPAGLYLHISPSGMVHPALLQAAANGMPLAAATHPLDTRPGGVCTLFEPETEVARLTRQSWLGQLRSLLGDAPRRQRLAAAAAKKALADHASK